MAVLAPVAAPNLRSDLELIQGVWVSVAGPRQARLLIAGRRFTVEFVGGDVYMGTFDLVPGKMDMHIEEGPPEHAGHLSMCIYHLDGGVLRWCPGRPGSDKRPSAFPDVDDSRYLSLVFRRAAPDSPISRAPRSPGHSPGRPATPLRSDSRNDPSASHFSRQKGITP